MQRLILSAEGVSISIPAVKLTLQSRVAGWRSAARACPRRDLTVRH
jgi:hypothetical protein